MNVNFKLSRAAVATTSAGSKRAIFETLATRFADTYGLDAVTVGDGLRKRERLGSTGFGRGVAIPHARLNGIEHPVAALLKLDNAVEFEAADGMPVDLVIGLISPVSAGSTHLRALAAISRMVRDDAIYESLIQAENSEALLATLTNIAGNGIANDNASGAKHGRA